MNVTELLKAIDQDTGNRPVAVLADGQMFSLGSASGFINADMADVVLSAEKFVTEVRHTSILPAMLRNYKRDAKVQIYADFGVDGDGGAYFETAEVRNASENEVNKAGRPFVVIVAGAVICC